MWSFLALGWIGGRRRSQVVQAAKHRCKASHNRRERKEERGGGSVAIKIRMLTCSEEGAGVGKRETERVMNIILGNRWRLMSRSTLSIVYGRRVDFLGTGFRRISSRNWP